MSAPNWIAEFHLSLQILRLQTDVDEPGRAAEWPRFRDRKEDGAKNGGGTC